MLREFLHSKIHRATITDSNLNYVGSITIDEDFLDKANIREWEKVEILDINNGERFQTYALKGIRGSKCFCVNGAAARKVQTGDKIIIVTYAQMNEQEIKDGYKKFKEEKNANAIQFIAKQHGVELQALNNFINEVIDRMIFDGGKLSDLLAPLELGWKARTQKELELMEDLIPLLKRLANGHEIVGLNAYE